MTTKASTWIRDVTQWLLSWERHDIDVGRAAAEPDAAQPALDWMESQARRRAELLEQIPGGADGMEIKREPVACPDCGGAKMMDDASHHPPYPCPTCGGAGRVYLVTRREPLNAVDRAPDEEDWGDWLRCDAEPFRPHHRDPEVFRNNLYQVIRDDVSDGPLGRMIYLSVKRLDRGAIHDWRHLQWIKNDLVGPEAEGIELYPAESRLVDNANQYHLWIFPHRLPFGFDGRLVSTPDGAAVTGATQRPFPANREPEDAQDELGAVRHLLAEGHARFVTSPSSDAARALAFLAGIVGADASFLKALAAAEVRRDPYANGAYEVETNAEDARASFMVYLAPHPLAADGPTWEEVV